MQNDEYLKLAELARELIAATPDRVAATGHGEFCELCRRAEQRLREAKPQVGRGGLMVELGLKVNDIREHPEKYRESPPKWASPPEKPAGKVPPKSPPIAAGNPSPAQALPDPDDEPW